MTEKDYKTACRMITYDRIQMLRNVGRKSLNHVIAQTKCHLCYSANVYVIVPVDFSRTSGL